MKFNTLILFLAVAVSAVSAGLPVCGPLPTFCETLYRKVWYRQCYAQISGSGRKVTTCTPAPLTATSTSVIQPTTKSTKTVTPRPVTKRVTMTQVITRPPVVPATITRKTTTTVVQTTTVIDTTSSTHSGVYTATQTNVFTITERKALPGTTITTTVSSPPSACTPGSPGVSRREVFQAACSCFLSEPQGRTSTVTVTSTVTNPTRTDIIYQTAPAFTVTMQVPILQFANGGTLAAPEVTQTISEARTETRRSVTTIVATVIRTVTSTESKTTTATIGIDASTATVTVTAGGC